ncbi:MAG: DUF4493 domain-containing protein [Alistipes sp.]|nr:DUF4493 domain-containing protein [Alistipes sp.]
MKKIFALVSAVLLIASCAKEAVPHFEMATGEGAMRLGVAMQSEVSDTQSVVVKIYKVEGEGDAATEKLIRRYNSLADVPEYLNILAGNYIAKVQVGEKRVVSLTEKYYYGEQSFTVKAGEVEAVTVDCELCSTIVRVVYDASVAEKLNAGYFTTVAIDDAYDAAAIKTGDVHSFTFSETSEGYVMMPEGETSLYWHFEGSNDSNGSIVKEGLIENVKPSAKYTITLKYSKDAPGILEIEAKVDESIEEKEDNIMFSPDPTILPDNFDMTEEQSSIGEPRKYMISALAAIDAMSITLDGTDYDLLSGDVQGVTVEKVNDTAYNVTISHEFFLAATGGHNTITINVEDVDGGKVHKDVVYNVQGIMPIATSDYDLWLGNVTFKANVLNTAATSIKVAYRANGGEWTMVDAVASSDGSYTATGSDFAAEKNYEYKLVVDGVDSGKMLAHTTATGSQLPNAGLEDWHTSGTPYYPYAQGSAPFWLTGNEGSASFGGNLTVPSNDIRPGSTGSYSAYLQSKYVVIKFAAGNLFTGGFRLNGTDGIVSFGRPFTFNAKPKSFTYWMKNNEGAINRIKGSPSGTTINSGDPDRYVNVVILANWTGPYSVDTSNADATTLTEERIKNMDGVIAYAWMVGTDSNPDWTEISRELTYLPGMENVKPNYVVVSFTPSGYGDYFTGSEDSWMYVDDVRFNY